MLLLDRRGWTVVQRSWVLRWMRCGYREEKVLVEGAGRCFQNFFFFFCIFHTHTHTHTHRWQCASLALWRLRGRWWEVWGVSFWCSGVSFEEKSNRVFVRKEVTSFEGTGRVTDRVLRVWGGSGPTVCCSGTEGTNGGGPRLPSKEGTLGGGRGWGGANVCRDTIIHTLTVCKEEGGIQRVQVGFKEMTGSEREE